MEVRTDNEVGGAAETAVDARAELPAGWLAAQARVYWSGKK